MKNKKICNNVTECGSDRCISIVKFFEEFMPLRYKKLGFLLFDTLSL